MAGGNYVFLTPLLLTGKLKGELILQCTDTPLWHFIVKRIVSVRQKWLWIFCRIFFKNTHSHTQTHTHTKSYLVAFFFFCPSIFSVAIAMHWRYQNCTITHALTAVLREVFILGHHNPCLGVIPYISADKVYEELWKKLNDHWMAQKAVWVTSCQFPYWLCLAGSIAITIMGYGYAAVATTKQILLVWKTLIFQIYGSNESWILNAFFKLMYVKYLDSKFSAL